MQRYLLDTHTLLFAITDSPKLGHTARRVMCDAEHQLFFSIAAYWEICIKISIGKLKLSPNWQNIIEREMSAMAIQWLPVLPAHAQAVIDLPFYHRDPFDRMLIAQALNEKMVIVSRDAAFGRYGVSCVYD